MKGRETQCGQRKGVTNSEFFADGISILSLVSPSQNLHLLALRVDRSVGSALFVTNVEVRLCANVDRRAMDFLQETLPVGQAIIEEWARSPDTPYITRVTKKDAWAGFSPQAGSCPGRSYTN